MTLVGTALNLRQKMKIYPQELTALIKPQIDWIFADDGKEMDKTDTCRACKAVVFVH